MRLLYKISGITENNEEWEFIGYSATNDIDKVKQNWKCKYENITINDLSSKSILTKIYYSGFDKCIFELLVLDPFCSNKITLQKIYYKQLLQK